VRVSGVDRLGSDVSKREKNKAIRYKFEIQHISWGQGKAGQWGGEWVSERERERRRELIKTVRDTQKEGDDDVDNNDDDDGDDDGKNANEASWRRSDVRELRELIIVSL
jgi:hypothetical protein